jgi:hypothetical protein
MWEPIQSTAIKRKKTVNDTRRNRSLIVYASRAIVPRTVSNAAAGVKYIFAYTCIVPNDQTNEKRLAEIVVQLLEQLEQYSNAETQ